MSIKIFLAILSFFPAFYFQIFLSVSDSKQFIIWNGTQSKQFITTGYKIKEIDIDWENNLILACSLDSKIFAWDFINKTSILILDTSEQVRSIKSLNKSHFVAGLQTKIVIYSTDNPSINSHHLNDQDIKQIKYLKDVQKILIASLIKIIVFCLNTLKSYETNIDVEVWSLDVLNRSFIAAPCTSNWICIYRLVLNNKLVEFKNDTKTFEEKDTYIQNKVNAIKIINESLIVFGADVAILGVWNLQDNLITVYTSESIILCAEKISNDEFIFGAENGYIYRVKVSQLSNHIQINQNFLDKVNALKILHQVQLINYETTVDKETSNSQISSTISNKNYQTSYLKYETTNLASDNITKINNPLKSFSSFFFYSNTQLDFNITKSSKIIGSHSLIINQSNTNFPTNYSNFGNMMNNSINFSIEKQATSTAVLDKNKASNLYNENHSVLILENVNFSKLALESVTFSVNHNVSESTKIDINVIEFAATNFKSEYVTHKKIYVNTDNIEMMIDYLTKNIDFNDCLKNCSGHGKCKEIENFKYVCDCFENYVGPSCELNTIPCSSNPCRNNGTCNNNLINKTYTCECYSSNNQTSLFYGQNCENKVDICLNHSCSSNGVCNDENSEAKCKCFKGYSGDLCTIESSDVKTIKTMIRTASIVAIIVLILTYGIIIFNDIATLFCNKSSEPKK